MTDRTIAELVQLVKLNIDEESTRQAARELHARGVSIVGIIPTTPRPKARPVLLDSICGY